VSSAAQLAGLEREAHALARVSPGLGRGRNVRSALSLFDRLTDDDPSEQRDAEHRRIGSARELQRSVVRDLSALLNSVRTYNAGDLADYPRTATSVLNYGLPDLTGRTRTSVDVPAWQVLLRRAILDFEPRILSQSVRVLVPESDANRHIANSLQFTIDAALRFQPAPLWMRLHTEIDLETGNVQVQGGAASFELEEDSDALASRVKRTC